MFDKNIEETFGIDDSEMFQEYQRTYNFFKLSYAGSDF